MKTFSEIRTDLASLDLPYRFIRDSGKYGELIKVRPGSSLVRGAAGVVRAKQNHYLHYEMSRHNNMPWSDT